MNVVSAAALSERPGHLVRFHGLFNGGAVLGAIVTGIALELGVELALGLGRPRGRRHHRRVDEPLARACRARRAAIHPSLLRALASLRHEGLVILAIVFAASAMVEGGIATWGVLYLRGHLDVGVLAGVGAYVVGQALATVTRIAGGSVASARCGTRKGIAIGAGVTAFGIALEALTSVPVVGAVGLALACVGITVVWPLLLADVNNEARHPALAIGGVTAAGYLGMVAGPPIVGILSGIFASPPACWCSRRPRSSSPSRRPTSAATPTPPREVAPPVRGWCGSPLRSSRRWSPRAAGRRGRTSPASMAPNEIFCFGGHVSGFHSFERRNAFEQWKKHCSTVTLITRSAGFPRASSRLSSSGSLRSCADPLTRSVSVVPGTMKRMPTWGFSTMLVSP